MSDKPPTPPPALPPDDDDDLDGRSTIHPARYERTKAQRDAARRDLHAAASELAAARQRIQALESLEPKVTAAEAAKAAAEAKLTETMEAHEHYRAAASSGIADPEVFELFRWQYGRVSADDPKKRPAFADWIKDLRAKPDDAPATLRPHLGSTEAPPPKKGTTTPAPGSRTPPPPLGSAEERRKLAQTPEGREQIRREILARRKAEADGTA